MIPTNYKLFAQYVLFLSLGCLLTRAIGPLQLQYHDSKSLVTLYCLACVAASSVASFIHALDLAKRYLLENIQEKEDD